MNELLRKLAALGIASFTGTALWLLFAFASTRWAFFFIITGWSAVVIITAVVSRRMWPAIWAHLPLSMATFFASAGLLILIEWQRLIMFVILLAGFFLALLWGWTEHEHLGIQGIEKPFRRMKMMLWVFDGYAIVCTLFAINIFFPRVPFWILNLFGAAALAFISFMIWRMYYQATLRAMSLWLLLVAISITELMWVFHFLPLGYMASGLLVAWVWYLLQLFVRFHFAPEGIVWKRQIWFLTANAGLFLALLLAARWTPNIR